MSLSISRPPPPPLCCFSLDTLAQLQTDAKRVESLLADKKAFKDFYRWLFDFVKEEEERKTIGKATRRWVGCGVNRVQVTR